MKLSPIIEITKEGYKISYEGLTICGIGADRESAISDLLLDVAETLEDYFNELEQNLIFENTKKRYSMYSKMSKFKGDELLSFLGLENESM